MDFGANKTPIEVIKEGAFGATYFRDLFPDVNGKWYKKSRKKPDQLKDIAQKYYCSDYYDVSVNKYGVKCGTLLRFWGSKGWINEIDPNGWFQWYFRYWLGRRSEGDERQINRWKRVVSRFRGKLVKMIKHVGSKYDDYSISPKNRYIKLPQEEKDKIKEYQRKRYQQLTQYKKEALQNNWVFFLLGIVINKKTLKFESIRINKKEFHKSKQPINLDLVNAD